MNIYIIHVKSAIERKVHINKELLNKNLTGNFILEGDKDSIDQNILDKYFAAELKKLNNAATSCAFKHILAYEKMVKGNEKYALILEDDIVLKSNFKTIFAKVVEEIEALKVENMLISLEDSNLEYVSGHERKKNKYLYQKQKGRTTGAYLIDLIAAKNILGYIAINKCAYPIDWFHNECVAKEIIKIYWCQPTIATQASLSGGLKSLIDNNKIGFFTQFSFSIQKAYKKILYWLR
jgi:glycosyl transferase family 25